MFQFALVTLVLLTRIRSDSYSYDEDDQDLVGYDDSEYEYSSADDALTDNEEEVVSQYDSSAEDDADGFKKFKDKWDCRGREWYIKKTPTAAECLTTCQAHSKSNNYPLRYFTYGRTGTGRAQQCYCENVESNPNKLCNGAVHPHFDVYQVVASQASYTLVKQGKNFNDANAYCKTKYGSSLATVTSGAQQAQIKALAKGARVWIGFNDIVQNGKWVWTSGSTASYSNWSPGEPNGNNAEACLEVMSNGLWNDLPCNQVLPFICDPEKSSQHAAALNNYKAQLEKEIAAENKRYDSQNSALNTQQSAALTKFNQANTAAGTAYTNAMNQLNVNAKQYWDQYVKELDVALLALAQKKKQIGAALAQKNAATKTQADSLQKTYESALNAAHSAYTAELKRIAGERIKNLALRHANHLKSRNKFHTSIFKNHQFVV